MEHALDIARKRLITREDISTELTLNQETRILELEDEVPHSLFTRENTELTVRDHDDEKHKTMIVPESGQSRD